MGIMLFSIFSGIVDILLGFRCVLHKFVLLAVVELYVNKHSNGKKGNF